MDRDPFVGTANLAVARRRPAAGSAHSGAAGGPALHASGKRPVRPTTSPKQVAGDPCRNSRDPQPRPRGTHHATDQPLRAAVLDALHEAASEADFDRYFSLYANEAVFLGTDATERWTREEFMDYARAPFEAGTGWTYRTLERHVAVAADGRTAWFDERLENAGLGETRGSGVLVMEDGSWKIAQYNLTIPVPNEMALEVARTIRALKENCRGGRHGRRQRATNPRASMIERSNRFQTFSMAWACTSPSTRPSAGTRSPTKPAGGSNRNRPPVAVQAMRPE